MNEWFLFTSEFLKNANSYFPNRYWILVIIGIGCVIAHVEDTVTDRKAKLLNVFNIVKFPNDGCNSSISNVYGVCYTASECTSLGGTSTGSCASGFGVCCTFSGGCSGSTSLNNTYFKSSESDSSPCVFNVCKSSDDVCQIRLGFDTFDIAQPTTTTYLATTTINQRTWCKSAQFTATSNGNAPPILCGTNTGYHMILEAHEYCNSLHFAWSTSTTRSWNIHIMQISCDATWKPPVDCLQYFTGITGYIYSYNYAGGTHLANQDYTNCIRTEQGYCSIEYTPVNGKFQVSGSTTAPLAANVGDTCSRDFIIVPGLGTTAGATSNFDRLCGSLFSTIDTSAIGTTVFANKQPFQVGVYMDSGETNPATTTLEASLGFYIYYSQTACT